MRTFAFLLSLIVTISLTWVLCNPVPLENQTLPPFGSLFNPFTGFWQNGEPKQYASYSYTLNGTSQPVTIVFDDRLVPHIFAQNEKDALFAQGFVTAQYRLFQMDLATRAVSGRLSEILGDKLLEVDKLQRRKGLVYGATNTLKVWQQTEAFKKLEAYTAGVNAYINSLQKKDYPVEFKLLNFEPELWTPLKTSLMLKNMAQTLCMREDDLAATNTLAHFGKETFDFLFSDNNPKESPVIPLEVKWDFKPQIQDSIILSSLREQVPLPRRQDVRMPDGIGSNNWAVSGKKTNTNGPILCNDPHLPLTLPSIWYEVQLHSPEQNVYGVSLPGVPGVMIGFNKDIAWGMTNVSHDVLDWYTINWAEAKKESYFYDGKLMKVDKVIERYDVKGRGIVYDTVKYTVWGPVVYESEGHAKQDLAMRWMAHFEPPASEIEIISNLNKSKNFDDYAAAIQPYSVPAQNFIFASRSGDIALKVQGRFPNKRITQGRFIQDGSYSSNDWQGFIPEVHNPMVKNPESGFVSSANQRSTGPDYPYYYNGSFEDYRGRVLNDYLEKMSNITTNDMKGLQNDNFSLKAKDALKLMLPLVDRSELDQWEEDYLNLLSKWDCRYAPESKSPILFEKWFSAFYDMIWDEMEEIQLSKDILMPEEWRTIALLEQHPEHIFFDQKKTADKEVGKNIVNLSFRRMCSEISTLENEKISLVWKDQQNISIKHLLRKDFFSAHKIAIGGTPNALNAMNTNGFGPSWRMIVSFEDELKAYGVYPGGQSGNPGSIYYDNMIEPWAKGDYFELLFVDNPEALGSHKLFEMELQ
jgi:penicillin G amidase